MEFEIASDNNVYIDPGDINLSLAVKIEKGNDGDEKLEWDETEKTGDEVGFINNVMHSLFKNCEVFVNQQSISESNGLYAHKAYVETEWSYSAGSKNTFIATQGYGHVSNPNEYASHTKAGRMTATRKSQTLNLYGPLAIDFFAKGSLKLTGKKMLIKLVRSSPKFVLFAIGESANETYNVVIEKAALIVEKKILRENSHNSITKTLALTNAQYNFHETLLKTFIMPANQNSFKQEDIFNAEPIRRLAIAMCHNGQFSGELTNSPFAYQQFDLNKISISRGGNPIVELNAENLLNRLYRTTLTEGFKFDNTCSPGITIETFPNHFVLCFDLTPTKEAHKVLRFKSLASSVNLELGFSKAQTKPLEIFLMGEVISTVFIDKDKKVWKKYG